MEPAGLIVNHIRCQLHKEDLIRKVGISNDELRLLCVDCCLEGDQNQERYTLEDFMRQVIQAYSQIPKLQQLPDSTNEILATEDEIMADFSHHIEQEKEKVNAMIDKLRQSVYQKLEMKKRKLFADLEAQVKALEDVLSYYKKEVYFYKEGRHQHDDFKGPETIQTFETFFKEVSKISHATELQKLLQMHFENWDNGLALSGLKEDEAKTCIINGIRMMDYELLKRKASKPLISYGSNNESLDELLKNWDEQVDQAINALEIDLKNPVQAIKFQVRDSIFFDSVILEDSNEGKEMITNWVFETMEVDKGPLKLLYRGSRDGFSAVNFHQNCDNRGPTVVLIKSNYGKIFGGFTDASWNGYKGYSGNKHAFVFSVDRKAKYPIKFEDEQRAIYCNSNWGPTFGYGHHDIYIPDTFNTSEICESRFPSSYACCENVEKINYGSDFLAGAFKFSVAEIEVYSLEN